MNGKAAESERDSNDPTTPADFGEIADADDTDIEPVTTFMGFVALFSCRRTCTLQSVVGSTE